MSFGMFPIKKLATAANEDYVKALAHSEKLKIRWQELEENFD
jgi:hypothetical protein